MDALAAFIADLNARLHPLRMEQAERLERACDPRVPPWATADALRGAPQQPPLDEDLP